MRWKGKPLDAIKLPRGEWEFNQRFYELKTARAWGLTPNEFWALDDEQQAWMLAVQVTEANMAAVEAHEQTKEIEKGKRKGGKGKR